MFSKHFNRLKLLGSYFGIRQERLGFNEYLDFIVTAAGGLFRPLQVRSEVLSMLELVKQLEPKVVLEIGTANGGTLFMLARASAPDAHLISLDLPNGEFGGGYSPIRIPIYKWFARGAQKVSLLRADSHAPESLEAVKRIMGSCKIDFLFIDGDHSYDGVKKDFDQYAPLVRPGGLIALHDVAKHPESHKCDVDLFWEELKGRFRTQEFIESKDQGWAGIGVVFV